jgi:hypothetical protein
MAAPNRRRPAFQVGAVLPGAVLILAIGSGCAPQSPDHSSWTDQAHQSLEDAGSEVATVALLLRVQQDDGVFQKYQQVVARDSESAVGTTLERFGGEQPPPADDEEYHRVTGLLSDASDLLSQVRIAVVRADTARYPDLVRQLTSMQDRLRRAEKALRR